MHTTLDSPAAVATASSRSHWIDDWRPDDRAFWDAGGARIARRNLVFSIFSEHIGFCIWSMWSVFVLFLGKDYGLQPSQKFLLTTLPTAVGSVLRVPYTFAVAKFGGRDWTIVSAALLLIPSVVAAIILEPGVSFSTLLIVAAFAGIGGGNFSSSMSNIDAFCPQRLKGWALGLNAGGGNLGAAAVQLVGLAVLATAGAAHPRVILAVYIPLIVVATACAALFMGNLSHVTNERGAMREVARDDNPWIISVLYLGTLRLVHRLRIRVRSGAATAVREHGPHADARAGMTFLGPLPGSLIRPIGGKLADRLGGAKVSACAFAAMAVGGTIVLVASIQKSLPLFIVGFISPFVLSGRGNGSVYKMIPAIFRAKAALAVEGGAEQTAADHGARRSSRALIGIAGAIGAMGGVGVNIALRQSFLNTGTGNTAYAVFIGFFVVCLTLTSVVYLRPSSTRLAGV